MPRTTPGEIWLIDLGYEAKTRPCLIVSDYPADDELAILILIPHTTAVRHNRWELEIPKSFLQSGAFHLQQIRSIPIAKLQKKLGVLTEQELQSVRSSLSVAPSCSGMTRDAPATRCLS